jgi:DNA-binding beta-propeller fold protein YncE
VQVMRLPKVAKLLVSAGPVVVLTCAAAAPSTVHTAAGAPARAPVALVSFDGDAVLPINTVTHRRGQPIVVLAGAGQIAITPDGKTAYVGPVAGGIAIAP